MWQNSQLLPIVFHYENFVRVQKANGHAKIFPWYSSSHNQFVTDGAWYFLLRWTCWRWLYIREVHGGFKSTICSNEVHLLECKDGTMAWLLAYWPEWWWGKWSLWFKFFLAFSLFRNALAKILFSYLGFSWCINGKLKIKTTTFLHQTSFLCGQRHMLQVGNPTTFLVNQ